MPKSRDPSKYPAEYHRVLLSAFKQPVKLIGNKSQLQNLRFDLYAYRTALQHSQHRDAYAVGQLQMIIEAEGSQHALTIRRVDLSPTLGLLREALSQQPLEDQQAPPREVSTELTESINRLTSPLQPTEDPMESALEKLGYFSGVKK